MKIAAINLTGGGMNGGYGKYLLNVIPRMADNPAVKALLCAFPESVNVQDWFEPFRNVKFVSCKPFRLFHHSVDAELRKLQTVSNEFGCNNKRYRKKDVRTTNPWRLQSTLQESSVTQHAVGWAADGYRVRPYRDFNWKDKLIKASIPIRNSVVWRALFMFPKRFYRHLRFLAGKRYKVLMYKKIRANWDRYWTSDSDACNSIDPHDAILWFESNGFKCLSHPMHLKALFVRTGGLVFKKKNP
jgi:hypothetical protein